MALIFLRRMKHEYGILLNQVNSEYRLRRSLVKSVYICVRAGTQTDSLLRYPAKKILVVHVRSSLPACPSANLLLVLFLMSSQNRTHTRIRIRPNALQASVRNDSQAFQFYPSLLFYPFGRCQRSRLYKEKCHHF